MNLLPTIDEIFSMVSMLVMHVDFKAKDVVLVFFTLVQAINETNLVTKIKSVIIVDKGINSPYPIIISSLFIKTLLSHFFLCM